MSSAFEEGEQRQLALALIHQFESLAFEEAHVQSPEVARALARRQVVLFSACAKLAKLDEGLALVFGQAQLPAAFMRDGWNGVVS